MSQELSGRELDLLVATKVMGFRREANGTYRHPSTPFSAYPHVPPHKEKNIPRYSISIESAMGLEDRIAELGLQNDYIAALWDVIGAERGQNFWTAANFDALWKCIHATPKQRCLAALKAINGDGE